MSQLQIASSNDIITTLTNSLDSGNTVVLHNIATVLSYESSKPKPAGLETIFTVLSTSGNAFTISGKQLITIMIILNLSIMPTVKETLSIITTYKITQTRTKFIAEHLTTGRIYRFTDSTSTYDLRQSAIKFLLAINKQN